MSTSEPPFVKNAGGTPSIQEGSISTRPPSGIAGRLFLDTVFGVLYRDTGNGWVRSAVGPQGPQGNTGPQGPQGNIGPQGEQGPPGSSFITGIGAPTCSVGQIGDVL